MKYSVLFLIAILSSCASTNDYNSTSSYYDGIGPPPGMPHEPGKCYAKSFIEDVYEISTIEFVEYRGDSRYENVEIEEVEISAPSTTWEKRKADKNCLSENPNDCYVWCLIEIPGQYITVLKDTTQSSNWEIKKVEMKELIKKGGFTEWNEVICNGDVTPQFYRIIRRSLHELGFCEYDPKEVSEKSVWDEAAKVALETFQRKRGLPIGNLNIATLEALGVKY